jgi:hypothetical protein
VAKSFQLIKYRVFGGLRAKLVLALLIKNYQSAVAFLNIDKGFRYIFALYISNRDVTVLVGFIFRSKSCDFKIYDYNAIVAVG